MKNNKVNLFSVPADLLTTECKLEIGGKIYDIDDSYTTGLSMMKRAEDMNKTDDNEERFGIMKEIIGMGIGVENWNEIESEIKVTIELITKIMTYIMGAVSGSTQANLDKEDEVKETDTPS